MTYQIRPVDAHIGYFYLIGTHTGGLHLSKVVGVGPDYFRCRSSAGVQQVPFTEVKGLLVSRDQICTLLNSADLKKQLLELEQIALQQD